MIDDDKPPLNEALLAHYGVKGMRWGVRNPGKTAKIRVKPRTESMSVKLKNGDTLSLDGEPTPAVAKLLGRMSQNQAKAINNYSSFKIRDPSGNRVGEMSFHRESATSLNVVWVGVNNDQRGKGYATAAMRAAVDHSKKQGLKTVTLEVPGKSPDARAIYEKMGFKETKVLSTPEDDDYWGGLTAMRLDLND